MALHFERSEFDARRDRLMIEMAEKKLDAILLFAQESMYWLTGYDTFGYCFFQCLVVKADGQMVLTVNNPDSGSATEEIEVDYDAAPIDIGFNARYLLDITAQLDGDTGLFKLADPGSPTIVQDREGASALYVLMPMRV